MSRRRFALTLLLISSTQLAALCGKAGPDPDVNDDGVVNVLDGSLVGSCLFQDPAQVCRCRRADADRDGDVDAEDLSLVQGAFGEDGYPVVAPDTSPPGIALTSPMDGDVFASTPIPVEGTLDEAVFSLTVNGVPAPRGMGPLFPFMGEVALAAGANTVTVVATDLACNEASVSVTVSREEADTVSPVAQLSAPSQVQASEVIRATAMASDDDAVASLSFLVDGLLVKTQESPPYELSYNAPSEPGRVLEVEVQATDPSGNVGTATAPPYEIELVVPADAVPGSALSVRAEAEDTSRNTATAEATLVLVAEADTEPPSLGGEPGAKARRPGPRAWRAALPLQVIICSEDPCASLAVALECFVPTSAPYGLDRDRQGFRRHFANLRELRRGPYCRLGK